MLTALSPSQIYIICDYINRRICMHFDPAKDSIVPISNRPDLSMHLRYRSVPSLLFNKALIPEFNQHCIYCHCAISSRAIHKHYKDAHPHLLVYEPHCRDQVRGLANLGSG